MEQSGMQFEARMDLFFKGIESLKERDDALTMNLELMSHDIEGIKIATQQDTENIRALVRIAEMHDRRLSDHEGQ